MTTEQRIALLKEVLMMNTCDANEGAIADCLERHLQKNGISSKQIKFTEERNSFIQWDMDRNLAALFGHRSDPIQKERPDPEIKKQELTEKNGKIYGSDGGAGKSALVAMVLCMMELSEEKIDLKGHVRLLAAMGEATGLRDANRWAGEEHADDKEMLMIGEPAGRHMLCVYRESTSPSTALRAENGQDAKLKKNANTIDELLAFYSSMIDTHSVLRQENVAMGKLVYCSSMPQPGGAAHGANLPVHSRAALETGNERMLQTVKSLVSTLQRTAPDVNVVLTVKQSKPSTLEGLQTKWLQTAQEEVQKKLDHELLKTEASSSGNAKKLMQKRKKKQMIVLGPGNGIAQQAEECIDVLDFLGAVDMYKNMIKAYFAA